MKPGEAPSDRPGEAESCGRGRPPGVMLLEGMDVLCPPEWTRAPPACPPGPDNMSLHASAACFLTIFNRKLPRGFGGGEWISHGVGQRA